MRFQAGQVIVRRYMHPDERIGAVQAGRVVSDDDQGLLLWIETGSATMRRTSLDGTPTRALPIRTELTMPTVLAPATWDSFRTLMLMPTFAHHSVWWSWTPESAFTGWYVNLESPVRRWPGGVDVDDHALDLIVAPDRTVRWKDEGEFAEQTGDPLFWDAVAAGQIRAEAERLLDLAHRAVFPFDGTWLEFQPDPVWQPTTLPHWWDVPASGSTVWDDAFYRGPDSSPRHAPTGQSHD